MKVFQIALLLMSLAMFGCTETGPATPPENPDPAPEEGPGDASAPALSPDGSEGDAPPGE